jgi:hypothetical protein
MRLVDCFSYFVCGLLRAVSYAALATNRRCSFQPSEFFRLWPLVVASILASLPAFAHADESAALDLFNQRIMPIFRSPDPSSCVQCHLSSVDLTQYILPSHEATFVSLRDQGLIDLEQPAKSKILELIRMGDKDLDEGAKLIHEQTRKAEFGAFAAWVKACCSDPQLRDLPASTELAKPHVPDEVIRHARKSRVVDSFVRNVWSQRMRCFPCHTPHEVDPENPKHQVAVKKQKEFAAQYDDAMLARLELFRETPEATLQYWVEASQATPDDCWPLINLAEPAHSLVVLKPMSKLPKKNSDGTFEQPSYRDPVSHMGGLKMHHNDQSYKSFMAWLLDYAKVVNGQYTSVAELPNDNWIPSQLVVRVKAAPDEWKVGVPVQMFLHAWDEEQAKWCDEPIAFTQGTVTPRRMVNGSLFFFAADDSTKTAARKEDGKLPRGRYLLKTYVDSEGKIDTDPTAILHEEDYFGAAEIPKARWREGFRFAEVVSGKTLKKAIAGAE